MARGEAALSKLQGAFFRSDWQEVLRLAKKYCRHHEIDEYLSNSLQALALFFLSRDRYLEHVPYTSPMLSSESMAGCEREFIPLPTELLAEASGLLKPSLKRSDTFMHPARIVSGLLHLHDADSGWQFPTEAPLLDSNQFGGMRDLFDYFCWLQVFVHGLTNGSLSQLETLVKELESIEADLAPPLRELYWDSTLKLALSLTESNAARSANGLRKYLWMTRSLPKHSPRLIAIRRLLEMLAERFTDHEYKRDVGEMSSLPISVWQPVTLREELLLLALTFVDEYAESIPLTKDAVQSGWFVIKRFILPKIIPLEASSDAVERILERVYDSFAVDGDFYDMLFHVKLDYGHFLDAVNVARQTKRRSKQATAFLRILEEPALQLHDIVHLKKLFIANPLDIHISEAMLYLLAKEGNHTEAWQLWQTVSEGSAVLSPFASMVAIELAYATGERERLESIVLSARLTCQRLMEVEADISLSSPSALSTSNGSAFHKSDTNLYAEQDARSDRSRANSLQTVHTTTGFSLQAGELRPILPVRSLEVSCHPSIEEWREKFYPMHAYDYRCLKRFGQCGSLMSVEEFPPVPSAVALEQEPLRAQQGLLALCLGLIRLGDGSGDEVRLVLQQAFRLDQLEPLVHLLRFGTTRQQSDLDNYILFSLRHSIACGDPDETFDEELGNFLLKLFQTTLRRIQAEQ